MHFRIIFFIIIFIIHVSVYADTSIYDYEEKDELIDRINNGIEQTLYEVWSNKRLFLTYRTDLCASYENQYLASYQTSNVDFKFRQQGNDHSRLYMSLAQDNYNFGFGSYETSFGLGNIYHKNSKEHFNDKVFSSSSLDQNGLFLAYNTINYGLDLFYSVNNINTIVKDDLTRKIVYYDSNKSQIKQYGIKTSYSFSCLAVDLLYTNFRTDSYIEDFANKKSSSLFSYYLDYHKSFIKLAYEGNYQFDNFAYAFLSSFSRDDFEITWKYKKLPEKSLAWYSSGISNKYNSNTEIIAGFIEFPLFMMKFKLAYEVKSNNRISEWSSKEYLQMSNLNKFKYRLTKEVYKDYQAEKHEKYSHLINAEIMKFSNSNISINYLLNTKKESGLAHRYKLNYNLKTRIGLFKSSLTILDNYKNEEIVQDLDQRIIATFYKYSEDLIIAFKFKTKDFHNISLQCNLLHSLYNNRLNSFRIDLNFLLK